MTAKGGEIRGWTDGAKRRKDSWNMDSSAMTEEVGDGGYKQTK